MSDSSGTGGTSSESICLRVHACVRRRLTDEESAQRRTGWTRGADLLLLRGGRRCALACVRIDSDTTDVRCRHTREEGRQNRPQRGTMD